MSGVLDEVFDMDAELGVRRGCWIECLTEMLDAVSDIDAGFSK